ncbi:MAG TPA: IclR family transcriptional regulator [Paenalcaligenes sp.]|nr:IclR family transcriptional regulator [Paenalcaligenes sp.]
MSQHPPAAAKVSGTAAFSKFVHLMQIVSDSDEALSIPELASQSGYPRPTVYRTVAGLVAEGLLVESLRGGTYQLGPRLIQLASRSWGRSELRLASVQALKELRDITGETVHLAVPNDQHMVYIEKLESPSAVRMASYIGSNVSMHSTSVGKAYLAALPADERNALIANLHFTQYMPNTASNAEHLKQQIETVIERGWSVDDEENEAGIYCFGAVIRGVNNRPVAAVSVSTLRFRQKSDPIKAYVEPLLHACNSISQRIALSPNSRDVEKIW